MPDIDLSALNEPMTDPFMDMGNDYQSWRDNLAQRESTGDPAAINPKTSAKGLYQFVPSWWEEDVKKAFGKGLDAFLPKDKSPEELSRSREDQNKLFGWYFKNRVIPSVKRLEKKFPDKSRQELATLVHYLGEGGATKQLSGQMKEVPLAEHNQPVDTYLQGLVPEKPKQISLSSLAEKPKKISLDSLQGSKVTEPESAALGAIQSLTYSWADEFEARLKSAVTGQEYDQVLSEVRQRYQDAEKANPKSYLAGEVVGGVAAAFVPGMGWANYGVKGAAIGGAMFGAGKADKLKDIPLEAATYSAGAAVTAGAFKLVAKAGSKLKPFAKAWLGHAAGQSAKSGRPMSKAAAKQAAEFAEEYGEGVHIRAVTAFETADKTMPETLPQEFIKYSQLKPAMEKLTKQDLKAFKSTWTKTSPELQQKHWEQYIFSKEQVKATNEFVDEFAAQLAKTGDPLEREFLGYLKDPLMRFTEYDRVFGTGVEDALAQFAESNNRVSVAAAPFLQQLKKLQSRNTKLFPKNKVHRIKQLMELEAYGADTGKGRQYNKMLSGLSDDQKALVNDWKKWFADAREHMIDQGYTPNKLEGYFPHQRVELDVAQRTMLKKWDRIAKEYVPGKARFAQFDEAIEDILGHTPKSKLEVVKAIDSITQSGATKRRLGQEAGALFRRGDKIPELLRETNVEKAALRYLNSNLKAVYYQDAFRALHSQQRVLRGLGANKGADVLDHFLQRMSGQQSNANAYLHAMGTRWKAKWGRKLDQGGLGPVADWGTRAMVAAPDFLGWTTSQIYPNLLGWNVAAPLRNLTQTIFLTAPEIGGGYGRTVTARGWSKAIKARLSKGKDIQRFLQDRGLVGDQFHGEAVRKSVAEGMRSVPGLGKLTEMIDNFSEFGMKLYANSDSVNRYLTWHIAQDLGDDIIKGSVKGAQTFMKRLPKGKREMFDYLVANGQEQRAKDELAKWLVRKTQFNYGKSGLSQFGQDYGRLVSMFTKWPMMVMGDITDLVKYRQGFDKIKAPALKYIAPMALLMLGDEMLEDVDAMDSPLAKLTMASSLTKYSPLSAVTDLSIPPLAKIPFDVTRAMSLAKDREGKRAAKQLMKTASPFAPGIGGAARIYREIEKATGEE